MFMAAVALQMLVIKVYFFVEASRFYGPVQQWTKTFSFFVTFPEGWIKGQCTREMRFWWAGSWSGFVSEETVDTDNKLQVAMYVVFLGLFSRLKCFFLTGTHRNHSHDVHINSKRVLVQDFFFLQLTLLAPTFTNLLLWKSINASVRKNV